jgi:hypothetical protein
MNARRGSLWAGAYALVLGIAASAVGQERVARPDADAHVPADAPARIAVAPGTIGAAAREPERWDLPRLFYDPKQRRVLDAADRALRLGLRPPGATVGGARFDGWLAGPTATHAWVNGSRYVADRDGRLRPAPGGTIDGVAMQAPSDDGARRSDRLDRTHGELIVTDPAETPLRLRVGEAEGQPPTPQIDAPGDSGDVAGHAAGHAAGAVVGSAAGAPR